MSLWTCVNLPESNCRIWLSYRSVDCMPFAIKYNCDHPGTDRFWRISSNFKFDIIFRRWGLKFTRTLKNFINSRPTSEQKCHKSCHQAPGPRTPNRMPTSWGIPTWILKIRVTGLVGGHHPNNSKPGHNPSDIVQTAKTLWIFFRIFHRTVSPSWCSGAAMYLGFFRCDN